MNQEEIVDIAVTEVEYFEQERERDVQLAHCPHHDASVEQFVSGEMVWYCDDCGLIRNP